jgi:hypothetical protein
VTDPDPARRAARSILSLLLTEHPTQLSREEIRRELTGRKRIDVDDALAYLTRAGLAHESDGYFWATRAAVRGDALT